MSTPETTDVEQQPPCADDPYRIQPHLAAALAGFQAELPPIGKGNLASIPGKEGKQGYRYTYADLADVSAAVLPLLGKHGMSWRTLPTLDPQGRFALRYDLTHSSGECTGGWWPLSQNGTPQQRGSEITYARRYALCAVTGVAPADEDDDGASATQHHRAAQASAPRSAAEQRPQRSSQPAASNGNGQPDARQQLREAAAFVLKAQTLTSADERRNWVAQQAQFQNKKIGDVIDQDSAERLGLDDAKRAQTTLLELAEMVCGYIDRHQVPVIELPPQQGQPASAAVS